MWQSKGLINNNNKNLGMLKARELDHTIEKLIDAFEHNNGRFDLPVYDKNTFDKLRPVLKFCLDDRSNNRRRHTRRRAENRKRRAENPKRSPR
jgi:hypothetical protein